MAFERDGDRREPLRGAPLAPLHEERRDARSGHLSRGTLACPRCDAPVALAERRLRAPDALGCPFCGHAAPLRDFLSLGASPRPARVDVRVVARERRLRA